MSDSNNEETMPWWGVILLILLIIWVFSLTIFSTAKTTTQVIDKSAQAHQQIRTDKADTINSCISAFPKDVDARSKCIEESQKSAGWQHGLEDVSSTILGYQAMKQGD